MKATVRTIEVCLSIGINCRVKVKTSSKREALAYARTLVPCEIGLMEKGKPETDPEVEFDESYEFLVGGCIDHAEIEEAIARKRARKAKSH